ncbi:hypothetical protein PSHT_06624 [Puccinia striiformis]|uniref:CREG-like beta-barrel domain-containing protein n=1 Tax=Puccinia striiformis TaxID=27350 RepID=A0A2S4W480_9BASI|nr:hypothetical protein PSHT_06624 [Puccinia striiformis]
MCTLLSTLLIGFLVSTAAHIPSQLTLFSNQFNYNDQNSTSTSSSRIHLAQSESSYQADPDNHPDPTLRGLPIGLQEYFAPYPNGDLVLLVLPISPIYGNVLNRKENSTMDLTLAINDELGTVQRRGAIWAANRRRLSFFGELEILENEEEQEEAKTLYEKVHPDSSLWNGQGGPHKSLWARLSVRKVYYFGGFGDRAAIEPASTSPQTAVNKLRASTPKVSTYIANNLSILKLLPTYKHSLPSNTSIYYLSSPHYRATPSSSPPSSSHHHHHVSPGAQDYNQSATLIDSQDNLLETGNYPSISEDNYTSIDVDDA